MPNLSARDHKILETIRSGIDNVPDIAAIVGGTNMQIYHAMLVLERKGVVIRFGLRKVTQGPPAILWGEATEANRARQRMAETVKFLRDRDVKIDRKKESAFLRDLARSTARPACVEVQETGWRVPVSTPDSGFFSSPGGMCADA